MKETRGGNLKKLKKKENDPALSERSGTASSPDKNVMLPPK